MFEIYTIQRKKRKKRKQKQTIQEKNKKTKTESGEDDEKFPSLRTRVATQSLWKHILGLKNEGMDLEAVDDYEQDNRTLIKWKEQHPKITQSAQALVDLIEESQIADEIRIRPLHFWNYGRLETIQTNEIANVKFGMEILENMEMIEDEYVDLVEENNEKNEEEFSDSDDNEVIGAESVFKKHIGETSNVNENEVQVQKEIEGSNDENPKKDITFQKAIVLFTPKENEVQHTEVNKTVHAEEAEEMVVDQTTKTL
uniref:Uncharacterized protein n=1 Tax=Lactuca sativa TaxID=4236 RepID=A0A9R1WLQ4_LACSA|nr:hypothetical protein LSAT_V11C100044240 [Lactuca sativa]